MARWKVRRIDNSNPGKNCSLRAHHGDVILRRVAAADRAAKKLTFCPVAIPRVAMPVPVLITVPPHPDSGSHCAGGWFAVLV